MKIQNNNGQYRITIPKDIAKTKGWKQGTSILIVLDGDKVILKELEGDHGE